MQLPSVVPVVLVAAVSGVVYIVRSFCSYCALM